MGTSSAWHKSLHTLGSYLQHSWALLLGLTVFGQSVNPSNLLSVTGWSLPKVNLAISNSSVSFCVRSLIPLCISGQRWVVVNSKENYFHLANFCKQCLYSILFIFKFNHGRNSSAPVAQSMPILWVKWKHLPSQRSFSVGKYFYEEMALLEDHSGWLCLMEIQHLLKIIIRALLQISIRLLKEKRSRNTQH